MQEAPGNRLGIEASAMPGALRAVLLCSHSWCPLSPGPGVVACRCCPGGISRSTRRRRYPSDMSQAEWAVCEPLLPARMWLAGRGDGPAAWCMRDVVDAIRYLTHNGRCGGR